MWPISSAQRSWTIKILDSDGWKYWRWLPRPPQISDLLWIDLEGNQNRIWKLNWRFYKIGTETLVKSHINQNQQKPIRNNSKSWMVFFHTIPYHTIPYNTIPYHTLPHHTISRIEPDPTIPYTNNATAHYWTPHHHNSQTNSPNDTFWTGHKWSNATRSWESKFFKSFCFRVHNNNSTKLTLPLLVMVRNKPIQDGGDADAPLWLNWLRGTNWLTN